MKEEPCVYLTKNFLGLIEQSQAQESTVYVKQNISQHIKV